MVDSKNVIIRFLSIDDNWTLYGDINIYFDIIILVSPQWSQYHDIRGRNTDIIYLC